MNKTLAFAKLDAITIKPYLTLKNLLLLVGVGLIVGYGTGEPIMVVSVSMMYGVLFASYPFSVGEKNGIDTLYATLSLGRGQVVRGRYLFAVGLNVLMIVVGAAVAWLVSLLTGTAMDVAVLGGLILGCMAVFTLIQSFQLPIYFALGYSKAKFAAYLPLVGFPLVVVLFARVFGADQLNATVAGALAWADGNPALLAVIVVAFCVVLLAVSCSVSNALYRKRDF